MSAMNKSLRRLIKISPAKKYTLKINLSSKF